LEAETAPDTRIWKSLHSKALFICVLRSQKLECDCQIFRRIKVWFRNPYSTLLYLNPCTYLFIYASFNTSVFVAERSAHTVEPDHNPFSSAFWKFLQLFTNTICLTLASASSNTLPSNASRISQFSSACVIAGFGER
jgi:hypothetical protein